MALSINGQSCHSGPRPSRTSTRTLENLPMNRVLVLVQNGVRPTVAPTNTTTTKKARRNRQTKPVVTVSPIVTRRRKRPSRFQCLPADSLEASAHPECNRVFVSDSFIFIPNEIKMEDADDVIETDDADDVIETDDADDVIEAEDDAVKFEAMLRVVSARFGDKTTDQDSCESRSHSNLGLLE